MQTPGTFSRLAMIVIFGLLALRDAIPAQTPSPTPMPAALPQGERLKVAVQNVFKATYILTPRPELPELVQLGDWHGTPGLTTASPM